MKHDHRAPEFERADRDLSARLSYKVLAKEAGRVARFALNTGNPSLYVHAQVARAEAKRRIGSIIDAQREVDTARTVVGLVCGGSASAWLHWSSANIARMRGDYTQSTLLLKSAVRDAWHSDRVALKYALAGLAEDERILGNYRIARLHHQNAMRLFAQDADARGVVWALEGIAQIDRMTGQYAAALAGYREAVRLAKEHGDRRGLAYALKGSGDCEVLLGRSEGLLSIEAACREFAEQSFVVGQAFAEKTKADAYSRLGRFSEAVNSYASARHRFASIEYPRGTAYAELGEAFVRLRVGQTDVAAALLVTASEVFNRSGIGAGMAQARVLRSQLGLKSEALG